jgi:hypothetical protein
LEQILTVVSEGSCTVGESDERETKYISCFGH